MATRMGNFTDLLLRNGVISPDQLSEADQMARDTNAHVGDCLIKLGYATGEDVMRAMAKFHGMEYVDLTTVKIPDEIIELVPESVARENSIVPLAQEDGALKVIVSDPLDIETIEKIAGSTMERAGYR